MPHVRLPKGVTHYQVGLYGTPIVFATTTKKFNRVREAFGQKESESFGVGRCDLLTNGSTTVILMGVFDGRNGTLAHEAAHAAFFILDAVGVPVEPGEANEAYCYLLGDIFEAFAPDLIKQAKP